MDFLILSPPSIMPAEPPAGAFSLAAALSGHGFHAGLLDLSLEFYHRVLTEPSYPGPSTRGPLQYLMDTRGKYQVDKHRSALGSLHRKLLDFSTLYPGWRLSLMDFVHTEGVHHPLKLAALVGSENNPFREPLAGILEGHIEHLSPRKVLISVSYLSQLPGAIHVAAQLRTMGVAFLTGGSLINSLATTGDGLAMLDEVLGPLSVGDGSCLITDNPNHFLMSRLDWPTMVSDKPYLSARPIVPITLSIGCHWRKCLFCPDRGIPYQDVPDNAIATLLSHMPREIASRRPVVHLLDSAIPPERLLATSQLLSRHGVEFYGFARPSKALLKDNLLEHAAEAGLLMLQLGGESGSAELMRRFKKGLHPNETEEVLRASASLGIRNYLYLLFGLPGETAADLASTKDLVVRNAAHIDFLNLSVFNLPKYCELTERAVEFGIEVEDFPLDGAINLYSPFTVSGASPRAQARTFLKNAFHPHPDVQRMVAQTPKWLRAAHMALLDIPGRR